MFEMDQAMLIDTPAMVGSTRQVSQLLVSALEERWRDYRTEHKRCQVEFSNEAVHDLRVATRRLLALIQVLHSLSPRPHLKKLMHDFKGQLDSFDKLRDIQVILAEIADTLPQLPQLQEFEEYLQEVEKGLLKTLRKKRKVIDLYDFSKRIHRLQASLKTESEDNLIVPLLQAVDEAFLVTQQRQRWINPAAATSIHRVRLAFKTFRYMVEVIHPLLNGFPSENLKRMHEYQSLMGEIQDVEVIVQALAEAPLSVASFDAQPVRRYYERCHAEAISTYLAVTDQLAVFWRPAPDRPFPWEK